MRRPPQGPESRRPDPSTGQRLAAECVGTFLLTFVACGADILDHLAPHGTIGHAARYIAPALMVMAMIYSLSAISGAHINPAVTLAFFARKCFPARRLAGYWTAQLVGACGAAIVLRALFGAAIDFGVTRPTLGFTATQGVVAEILLAFGLVYTILATSEEEGTVGKNAGLAVAGVVALSGLAFSPVSGASMNPARSFGPALISGDLHSMWIYILGPVAGALIAAVIVSFVHGPPTMGEYDAARGKHQHV